MQNLLGNATKFTESGHIKIEASQQGSEFQESGETREYLEIRITDTGIGILKEKLGDIFNLFEKGESTLARSHQGTGLGLTITRKLIEMQGGKIWAESVPGVGSSFIFTLPLSPVSPDPQISTLPVDKVIPREGLFEAVGEDLFIDPRGESESLEGNPKILLADDDPINIKILERYLGQHQCELEIAWDGISALDKINKGAFDLILLDIMMPRMSGYEVCRRIRNTFSSQQFPVIMLTAKIHLSEVDEGF